MRVIVAATGCPFGSATPPIPLRVLAHTHEPPHIRVVDMGSFRTNRKAPQGSDPEGLDPQGLPLR
jgi:hypothetical protein